MQEIVSEFLQKWDLSPYAWNLILIVASVLLGLMISFLLSLFIKKQKGKELQFNLAQALLRHLTAPISVLLPVFLFSNFIPLLRMPNSIRNRIETGVEIALIISFAWLLIRFVKVGQDLIRSKMNINTTNNLRRREIITQLIYIRRIVNFIIVLVATGAVLLTFDTLRKIGTGLLTGVGVGGIIIGFAAQSSLSNLLAGFQIAFTQPIRIDDEVIVENEFGKIEELTFTYVVVRIWDNRRMILPINYFLTKPFQNWTRTTSEIIGSVYFYVDYSLPVAWLRQQFMQVVQGSDPRDQKNARLAVTDLKKEVMEVRGIVSSRSSGDNFNLRCLIREELIKRINEQYAHSLPRVRAELTKETTDGATVSWNGEKVNS